MRNFRKDKEDSNAPEIIASLRAHGYDVTKCERPVDIHIYDPSTGKSGWAEIKTEYRSANIKRGQLAFLSGCRQPGTIVTNELEALIFARDFEGWTQLQKDAITMLLIRNPNTKDFKPAEVEAALGTYTGRKRVKK